MTNIFMEIEKRVALQLALLQALDQLQPSSMDPASRMGYFMGIHHAKRAIMKVLEEASQ